MQRQRGAYGYFAGQRFGTRDGEEVTDEIALNPAHFRSRTTRESLSTLAHEMCHLEQDHFGNPSRKAYHNREWAGMMKANRPHSERYRPARRQGNRAEGKPLHRGRRAFDRACAELEKSGFAVRYVELWGDEQARKKKAASKTKYTCPACGLNAWGKPEIHIVCGDCDERMTADEPEGEGEG